jgi:hypothetical protein
MALVDWRIKGPQLATCNCAWGCPCQFNALPTHGNCAAYVTMRIDEGHFGKTKLDGLKWALVAAWPGPIHLGNGKWQTIIDERADQAQRDAIDTIASGGETAEGATIFQVFKATVTQRLPTLFKPIEFEWDMNRRRGRVSIPGIGESKGDPILNPVTGAEHRAKVVLPEGFEYSEAEYGSSTIRATGDIKLEVDQGHAHFAMIHMGTNGVVHA